MRRTLRASFTPIWDAKKHETFLSSTTCARWKINNKYCVSHGGAFRDINLSIRYIYYFSHFPDSACQLYEFEDSTFSVNTTANGLNDMFADCVQLDISKSFRWVWQWRAWVR